MTIQTARVTAASLLLLPILSGGCAWVRSLRAELDGDESQASRQAANYERAARLRQLPPPPATVDDGRGAVIAGTPVDLSGTRAKSGRITKNDFITEGLRNENSLWSEEGQTNYLFARNKLKSPGDLISVVIEDSLRDDMIGAIKKLLPPELRNEEVHISGLSKDKDKKQNRTVAAAQPGQQQNETEIASEDLLTAEVLERYPNGNIRMRGIKRIPFKRRVLDVEVVAIARGADISEQDVVHSSKFFEKRVELYR